MEETKMMKPTVINPERAMRFNIAHALGFTMIELLMTIAIAGILTALAVPSFRFITNSNRIASEVNGLLGDLQLARAQAIRDGRNVTVCQSTDGANCTNLNDWRGGWIVFSDPTNVGVWDAGEIYVRKQKAFSGTDAFVASNNLPITFNRQGYAVGLPAAGTLLTLQDSTNNAAWTRCLLINFSGRMTSERAGDPTNVVPCP